MKIKKFNKLMRKNLIWFRSSGKEGKEINLSGKNLKNFDLSGKFLNDIQICKANLSYTDLSAADLCRANLRGADLTGAKLTGANLSGANLSGANLKNANLTDANLTSANLTGANLYGTKILNTNLYDAKGILYIPTERLYEIFGYFYNDKPRVRIGTFDMTIKEWKKNNWENWSTEYFIYFKTVKTWLKLKIKLKNKENFL